MLKILHVEDEQSILSFVKKGLEEAGYHVEMAKDGKEGFQLINRKHYDLLILDIMIPGMNGVELIRRIRQKNIRVPVLLLTAKDTVENRIEGLNAGADDYLVKPFSFGELLARIRALLRRPPLKQTNKLQTADLEMDLLSRKVRRSGQDIDLSPKEFSLLEVLMRYPGQVLSRTQLGEQVWNIDYYSASNVVDVYMGYLRKKVDQDFDTKLIHTIRGAGFKIEDSSDAD